MRLVSTIVYCVIGLIIAPFVGWAIFFASIPVYWKKRGDKKKPKKTVIDMPNVAIFTGKGGNT